ncbi:MAG: hypothetical protein BWY75_02127 [bacterium ADurb.Bin425]|nr:MAG: hypothetical protein BWY75_02127 [bacterium ADurb.Bin425]
MGGGKAVLVEDITIRGASAVELAAVPRSLPRKVGFKVGWGDAAHSRQGDISLVGTLAFSHLEEVLRNGLYAEDASDIVDQFEAGFQRAFAFA